MTGLRKARRQIPVNVRSWETYSIGLMRTVLMRLMVVLVKAAVFKSYCDLPNHSVIITGVFPG